jgi:hypothetical protein
MEKLLEAAKKRAIAARNAGGSRFGGAGNIRTGGASIRTGGGG